MCWLGALHQEELLFLLHLRFFLHGYMVGNLDLKFSTVSTNNALCPRETMPRASSVASVKVAHIRDSALDVKGLAAAESFLFQPWAFEVLLELESERERENTGSQREEQEASALVVGVAVGDVVQSLAVLWLAVQARASFVWSRGRKRESGCYLRSK